MDIVIFKELTTNDYINELKADAEKYSGLYVDMNEPEQRKYVKEKAELINGLLKKIDRKRIDAAKEYKQAVEKEAASIVEDLKIANLPYTLLIDEYKEERKKILDAEKARKQAIIDAEQFESDHEIALLMNKTFEYDREQELKQQTEHEAKIAEQAAIDALAKQKQIDEAAKQADIDAENARLANFNHVRTVNNEILSAMAEQTALPIEQLKLIIKAIAKQEIPYVRIGY